jgi:hypothetical protein
MKRQKRNKAHSSPAELKGMPAALIIPCCRRNLTCVASSEVMPIRVSSRGRIIRPKVHFDNENGPEDGVPVLRPIDESSCAENTQTCFRARAHRSIRLDSDATPKQADASVCDSSLERSAIAPQLREDMLQFLRENPDLRQKSRRTWERFKKKMHCDRSADSLKTHAASKLFRMEQCGERVTEQRPRRLRVKIDLWKR